MQPWCIHFPIWNQSVVPCLVLTVASWPAYRFLRRQIRWPDIAISWRIFHCLLWSMQSKTSLVAQSVKNLPAVQEIQVHSLGWGDALEKEMATHSSILAWKLSWTEEPGGLQSIGLQRVGHDWVTNTYLHSQRLWHSQQSRSSCFSETLLLFLWSSSYRQFDLWFHCLF